MNISHPESGYECEITLVEINERILSSCTEKLSRQIAAILKKRGVIVTTGTELSESDLIHFDKVINAAGNRPRTLTIKHELLTGASGRILTDNSLQVKGKPGIFAAGDTADVGGNDYQQIGVHAVKQGVLLRHNLKAAILGKPLKKYRPYPFNPLILSNGPEEAFMIMGKMSFRGRYFSVLKHMLDMRWIEKYTKEPAFRKSSWALIKEGFARSSRS
jgi:NADH dehydrogenase FAD-containing subunit